MNLLNHMRLAFDARPENESFARVAVSAFAVPLGPTMDVLSDIRTAVSEAVTNAIVHAYREQGGEIVLDAALPMDASDERLVRNADGRAIVCLNNNLGVNRCFSRPGPRARTR